jgi:hypothetical protein
MGLTIFLSYRRDDTSGHVGRLSDRLCARFGHEAVFRDLDSITPGRDFVVAIDGAIAASDAVLAVIGRNWLSARDASKRRRLDDPSDYVRVEIVTALEKGVRVIPLLVDGATMPDAAKLPEPLAPLARRHALELSDTRWDYDVQRLIEVLDPTSPETLTGSGQTGALPGRRRRPLRLVAGLATGLLLVVGLAIASLGGGGGAPDATASTTTILREAPTSAPPPTSPPMTAPLQPPTTAPPRTAAPPTAQPRTTPPPTSPRQTVPATGPPPTQPPTALLTANAVAGSWAGSVSDGSGGTFQIVLDVKTGCTIGQRCGSVYVSGNECRGDFVLYAVSGGTYEFTVANFTPGSGSACTPGPGEYLAPQAGGTLKYTTSYGPSGTLRRS